MAFTTVDGTVSRVFFEGKGLEITESFEKRDGTVGKTRWSVFFDQPHGFSEGDTLKVSGAHSDRVDEWVGKNGPQVSVKRTLNGARVIDGENPPAPVEAWAESAPDYTESTF